MGNGLVTIVVLGAALAGAPAAAADPAAPSPSPRILPTGTISTSTMRIGGNLRLRLGVTDAAAAPSTRVQSRVAGSMVDFYPVEGRGFHLSVGTQVFEDRDLNAEGNRAARGLLAAPPRLRDGTPRLLGRRRPTPALMVGYTDDVARDTSVGIEMGAAKGRGFASVDEMAKSGNHDGRGGMNSMLNVVVGRRF